MQRIKVQPISSESFIPFGNVIEEKPEKMLKINDGFTTRVDDLADLTFLEGGTAKISFFIGKPRPLKISKLESHPLGSQAFFPIDDIEWIVAVAEEPRIDCVKVFIVKGNQGVSYNPGIWHHQLLVLEKQKFIVIDRKGNGNNLKEIDLATSSIIAL